MLGLVEAARRYDPGREPPVAFSTYAMYWIKREIRR